MIMMIKIMIMRVTIFHIISAAVPLLKIFATGENLFSEKIEGKNKGRLAGVSCECRVVCWMAC